MKTKSLRTKLTTMLLLSSAIVFLCALSVHANQEMKVDMLQFNQVPTNHFMYRFTQSAPSPEFSEYGQFSHWTGTEKTLISGNPVDAKISIVSDIHNKDLVDYFEQECRSLTPPGLYSFSGLKVSGDVSIGELHLLADLKDGFYLDVDKGGTIERYTKKTVGSTPIIQDHVIGQNFFDAYDPIFGTFGDSAIATYKRFFSNTFDFEIGCDNLDAGVKETEYALYAILKRDDPVYTCVFRDYAITGDTTEITLSSSSFSISGSSVNPSTVGIIGKDTIKCRRP